ncbi:hypothetical protein HYU13_01975 [Candidatus Woesearchaeota archaeon]|nr:hypothetical protein [Candidatus Woesearchaeota archaeon]
MAEYAKNCGRLTTLEADTGVRIFTDERGVVTAIGCSYYDSSQGSCDAVGRAEREADQGLRFLGGRNQVEGLAQAVRKLWHKVVARSHEGVHAGPFTIIQGRHAPCLYAQHIFNAYQEMNARRRQGGQQGGEGH